MSKVYQYVEIVGTSTDGFREAISTAINESRKRYPKMRWFEITEQRGYISDDGVAWYQVGLKIGYHE